jgi:hypothetical protein
MVVLKKLHTDFSETNYDTKLHIEKINSNGTLAAHVGNNDDGGSGLKSILIADLGAMPP